MSDDRAIPDLPALEDPVSGTMLLPIWDGFQTVYVDLAALAQWISTAESIVPASEPLVGARAVRSSNLNIGSSMDIVWTETEFDQGGFWSDSDPSRFTIPAGVKKVRLEAGLRITGSTAPNASITIDKNGVEVAGQSKDSGFGNATMAVSTGVVEVEEGDVFTVNVVLSSYTGRTMVPSRSFFSIHAVEVEPAP